MEQKSTLAGDTFIENRYPKNIEIGKILIICRDMGCWCLKRYSVTVKTESIVVSVKKLEIATIVEVT